MIEITSWRDATNEDECINTQSENCWSDKILEDLRLENQRLRSENDSLKETIKHLSILVLKTL